MFGCNEVYVMALFSMWNVDAVFGQVIRDRKPTVQLQQGDLSGVKRLRNEMAGVFIKMQVKVYTESGRVADAFLGVPYAAPPVGHLRFAPPQKHHGWNGTHQATQYKPPCPQLPIRSGVTYIEDCLYLNIWTPEV